MNPTTLAAAALLTVVAALPRARAQMMPAPADQLEYYDADDLRLPTAADAHHSMRVEALDSVGGIRMIFYPSGKPWESTRYSNLAKDTRDGPSTTWYENGQLHSQGRYQAGALEGELLVYYPDGQLKRRGLYRQGGQLKGQCYGPAGQPAKCLPYEGGPTYEGGINMLLRDLSQNLEYPADALRSGVQGQVLVGFTVTRQGKLAGLHIVRGLSPSTDAEALRVVQELRAFAPAQRDQENIPIHFTVPITFALRP